ncbi:MAG: class I SAM-dependent methyltransferase [Oscillospiraceae bacterium]
MSTPTTLRPGGLELTQHALSLCGFVQGARLLDIGCGQGTTVAHLAGRGFQAFGIERDVQTVQRAKAALPTLDLIEGDAMSLPFEAQSMDGIFFECSLSVTGSIEKALDEAARVLRPGGRLVVSDLYGRIGTAHLQGALGDIRTQEMLHRAVSEAGFIVETFEDYSRALVEYAAERLWQGNTLCEFSTDEAALLHQIRCGYCLMIARREK